MKTNKDRKTISERFEELENKVAFAEEGELYPELTPYTYSDNRCIAICCSKGESKLGLRA